MKINTNLPGFTGYYGSIFDDADTSNEVEYINEQRAEKGLEPIDENLINWNYKQYYEELNESLTNVVEDFLIDLNMIKSIKFIKLHSPKYYNYTNDVIECEIEVNVKEVKKYIKNNIEEFETYLEDNFKSRSGFISFYEYDINFWLDKMKNFKSLDHIETDAILNFICENENFDIVNNLYNVGINDIPFLQAENFEELMELIEN